MRDTTHRPRGDGEEGALSRIVAFPRPREPENPPDNLPLQLTSFVGREREVAEVKELLAKTRLLTLTGPGGCGKTRLALAAASEAVEGFEDGAWWVELASLSDPDLVPQTFASTLGLPETLGRSPTEMVVEHLEAKKTLVILDNCEHLVDACADLVDTLLRSCPELRILATSREALNVGGEVSWPVPPLSLPDPRLLGATEGLARYESARLFVERARAVRPDFALTEGNAAAVARICYRLDGMPLAIELAAARAKVLSAEQISSRLEDSLGLLTAGSRTATPRQRTLRATLEWSHDLLSEPERKLLGRMAVFAGGWTLEAAEAVGAGEGIERDEVLHLLSGLVDKSLVLVAEAGREEGASSRYRMLEPVRQYGQERLEAASRMAAGPEEAERVRERHARHYLALAEEAEPKLRGPEQLAWLGRLELEHANLRAALSWMLDQDARSVERAGLGLKLATVVWQFWISHGHFNEGRRWLERGLSAGGAAPAVRAKALNVVGGIAIFLGDGRAIAFLEESLALFREFEDRAGIADALGNLGWAVVFLQLEKWRLPALREEAEALRREPPDRQAISPLLLFLAMAAMDEGDYERAAALAEEKLALDRELGNAHGATVALILSAMISLARGDHERAAALFEESVRLSHTLGDNVNLVYCLLGLAVVAASRGEPVRAARLWGTAEALQEVTGSVADSPFVRSQYDHEGHQAAARSQLDEEAWEAALAEGRAMTPEQAVAYALDEPAMPQEVEDAHHAPTEGTPTAEDEAHPEPYPDGLTAREAQVLGLLAGGKTNKQIAAELFLSVSTVQRHVANVYAKIGAHGRAEATAYAMSKGLARTRPEQDRRSRSGPPS